MSIKPSILIVLLLLVMQFAYVKINETAPFKETPPVIPPANVTVEELKEVQEIIKRIGEKREDFVKRCIEELLTMNISYEDAKKRCEAIAIPPLVTPAISVPTPVEVEEVAIEECIRKLIAEGVKEEDAKTKCRVIIAVPMPAIPPQEIKKCVEIERQIVGLKKRYEEATEEGKKKLLVEIERLSKELGTCRAAAAPIVAPAIPEGIEECAKFEISIIELKKEYIKADEEGRKQILRRIEEHEKLLKDCLSKAAPTAVPIVEEAIESTKECVEKLLRRNVTYEEAFAKCTPAAAIATAHVGVIRACKDIEEKVRTLMREFEKYPERVEEIKEKIEALRKEYTICVERPAVAPKPIVPYDACEEMKFLEEMLVEMERRIDHIKQLYANGTISRVEFMKYEIEFEHIKEKLEKVREACIRKEVPKETPCVRLDSLQKMYDELKIKIETIIDAREKERAYERLASILDEIDNLKEECVEKLIDIKDVATITDIQKAYETKSSKIIEISIKRNKTKEELLSELKELEEEKKKLIKEFAERMKELDAKKQTIIERLRIGINVTADEIPIAVQKVEIEIDGKEVLINPGKVLNITHAGVTARGELEFEYANGTLIGTLSKKALKVLPGEIVEKIKPREAIINLTIKDFETEQRYFAETEKIGKILWIFPITFKLKYEIDATTGAITKEERPWWEIFVTVTECPIAPETIPTVCFSGSKSVSYFSPYDVHGNLSQACDEMNVKGPGGYYAKTNCDYIYKYCTKSKTEIDKKKCECKCTVTPDVTTTLTTSVELPNWVDYDKAPKEHQSKWDTFMANLKTHEDGHLELCNEYKEKIDSELEALSASAIATKCSTACTKAIKELDKKIKKKFAEIMEEERKAHKEYDAETNHGETQGATIDCEDP